MKSKSENPQEHLADANARIQLFEELGRGVALINQARCGFPDETNERRLLKLAANALFYVSVRQLDGFRDFLAEMEAVDSDANKKKIRRVSNSSGGSKTGRSNVKRARP